MTDPFGSVNWNENDLNPLLRTHWRASLVPAAAVIPAPIAYIKVVAVKKLVVGFVVARWFLFEATVWVSILGRMLRGIRLSRRGCPSFTVKKSARSKQAYAVECISME
jgi:hypothetical protein